jgi:tRNA/rRNA methyltransferase
MSKPLLDNIVILLRGSKYPGNIGSAARAMHNMGIPTMRLVAPQCAIDAEAYRMACSGAPILEKTKVYSAWADALRGIHLLVGTTAKIGGNRTQTFSPRSLAPRILDHAAQEKIGILFGPEDTGLVDEDLMRCQLLARIPTHPGARSINLAQAVMIFCYEIMMADLGHEPMRVPRLASVEQAEAMFAQLEQSLLGIGFLHAQNAQHMMFAIRRLLGRGGLEKTDVGILRGIARQIGWSAGRHCAPENTAADQTTEPGAEDTD